MLIFNCSHESCAFFSKRAHGVKVHCSIVHSRRSETTVADKKGHFAAQKENISKNPIGLKRLIDVGGKLDHFTDDTTLHNSTCDPSNKVKNDTVRFQKLAFDTLEANDVT